MTIHHDKSDFTIKKADNAGIKWYKIRKQIFHPFSRNTIPVKINYKAIAGIYLRSKRHFFLDAFLNKFKSDQETVFSYLRPLLISVDEQLDVIERKINDNNFSQEEIHEFEKSLTEDISRIESELTGLEELNRKRLLVEYRKNLQLLTNVLEGINVNSVVSKMQKDKKFHKSLAIKISSFAESWHEDSSTYLNKIYLDVLMQSYKNIIKDKLAEFETVFLNDIHTGLLKKLAEVKSKLEKMDEDLSGIQGLRLSVSLSEEYPHIVSEFDTVTTEFREVENELPESLILAEFPNTGKKQHYSDNSEQITLPIRKITGYVIATKFIGSANDLLGKTMESIRDSIYKMNELLSLTRFNLENINSETEDRSGMFLQIRNETIRRLSREETKIEALKKELLLSMGKLLEETFDALSSHRIKDIFDKYSRFNIDSKGRAVKTKLDLSILYMNNLIKKRSARLLYSKSEGILLAKKYITSKDQASKKEKILDLIDKVAPKPDVLKELPHYYKNLFSGRSSIGEDFWIPRTAESARFDKAIKRFQSGVRGGIMLLGERNAGKTALCRYVAMDHFDEDKVHHIFPMPGGSVSTKDFRAQLQKSTNLTAGISEIFDTLPYGSVIVIHDLEMWWERSEQGFELINLILDLISQFSYKCLFIVNMNPFTFELIGSIHQMENLFTSIINCQPFNSQELKEMVMRRHRSSGLKFRLEKKKKKKTFPRSPVPGYSTGISTIQRVIRVRFFISGLQTSKKFRPGLFLSNHQRNLTFSPLKILMIIPW